MSEVSESSYDTVPYPRLSYVHTAPDRMATIATLLGLEAPSLVGCRVLEVGSAVGGNLIPMAIAMPESNFLGIDLSSVETEQAQEMVKQLGLTNIRFEQRDITQFEDELEPFDFIIAHGVFSWIPEPARKGLLETCARRLSEHGIAYISYNTYPGWHNLDPIRWIMSQATVGIVDPQERVRLALEAIQFARDIAPEGHLLKSIVPSYLEMEKGRLEFGPGQGISLILHDELSAVNDPFYLTEFVDEAAAFGLTYMADAYLPSSFPNDIPDDVIAAISKRVRSALEFEQQLDIVRHCTFRRSLLVRGGTPVQRLLRPEPELLRRFFVRSRAKPEEPVDINDTKVASFAVSTGSRITTDHPLTKAVMTILASSEPECMAFDELVQRAWAEVEGHNSEGPPEDEIRLLGANLLRGYTFHSDLVDLRLRVPAIALKASERPVANAYGRILAGDGQVMVSNEYHERLQLHPAQGYLLSLLDGTRDRGQLAEALAEMTERADGEVESDAEPEELVDQSLEFFRIAGMLLA